MVNFIVLGFGLWAVDSLEGGKGREEHRFSLVWFVGVTYGVGLHA